MLHYIIYKNKDVNLPWLTFIHGAGGSSSIWFKQIRAFSKYFNVLLDIYDFFEKKIEEIKENQRFC